MAIYQMTNERLNLLDQSSFSKEDVLEKDLQKLLRQQIEVIAPDTLVISEEFTNWDESKRRIDLLGIDKDANLVVIELKRTEDGGHMDLQAIRYAAMVSSMTFDSAVEVYQQHLETVEEQKDAREELMNFLQWDDAVKEENFGQEVRIYLVSADFSKEITSTVLWLNENGLNIKCIRLDPYRADDQIYLDIQQVIPLPEAEAYMIGVQGKAQKVKESRKKRITYTVITKGDEYEIPSMRALVLKIVKVLCEEEEIDPEDILALDLPDFPNRGLMESFPGKLTSREFKKQLKDSQRRNGKKKTDDTRNFMKNDELIYHNEKTYAVYNSWSIDKAKKVLDHILNEFSDSGISYREN